MDKPQHSQRLVIEAQDAAESDRYHRQRLLPWWDQERVRQARILVVGAGALGNEVMKLLALTGIGQVILFDMDRIEMSNLSRSLFFGTDDLGRLKAEVVAQGAMRLNPDIRVTARTDDLIAGGGLGLFVWADIVIGAVDNRLARVFINSACGRLGKAWVDGAIEGLAGTVRLFEPAVGPCYECTMNRLDAQLVAQRRSCAMLMRRDLAAGRVPNTAVAASVVAAMQVQEAVKYIHGQPHLSGEGIHLDGMNSDVSRIRYPRREECPAHDSVETVRRTGWTRSELTLAELLRVVRATMGPSATVHFSRDLVFALQCPQCGRTDEAGAALGQLYEEHALCPQCRTHRIARFSGFLDDSGEMRLDRTLASIGVPPMDLLFVSDAEGSQQAWLLDGDAPLALGSDLAAQFAEPLAGLDSIPTLGG